MKITKTCKGKLLKASLDPFLLQSFEYGALSALCGLIGILGMLYMYKSAAISYDIHINVIQKGTQMILDATLGHEVGVNREIFDNLFEVFKSNKLNHEQQVKALKALMNNIIEYLDTQALSELEGQKLQKVAAELRRLYERELKFEELINEVLKHSYKKSKGSWIE
jgi:hypothetical protein